MAVLNDIQIEDIRFRAEHCISKDQDCLDLLEYIDILAGDIDTHGSLVQKIVDNFSEFVDIDFDPSFTVDKNALKKFLCGGK